MKALMSKEVEQIIKDKNFTRYTLSVLLKRQEVTIGDKTYTLVRTGRNPR